MKKFCQLKNFAFYQAFVSVVTQRVNALEEAVSKAEKDLEPSKFRKVFSSFPKLVSLWTRVATEDRLILVTGQKQSIKDRRLCKLDASQAVQSQRVLYPMQSKIGP